MEFKWTVAKMQVADGNLVAKVDLVVTAIDGEDSACIACTRNLTPENASIPYENLTEQQVLNWCFAPEIISCTDATGVTQSATRYLKDEGEARAATQLAHQIAQKQIEPALPWA